MLNRIDGVPDICLVGLCAYNPPAILEAAPAKVAGRQGEDRRLRRGPRDAQGDRGRRDRGTVVQDPYNYGYKSVEMLAAEARGDKSKRVKRVRRPYRVITKDGGPDADDQRAAHQVPEGGRLRDRPRPVQVGRQVTSHAHAVAYPGLR